MLKVRYAYALAVLMGALNIVPIVGAMISMALVLLAAATDSWEKVVGVLCSTPSTPRWKLPT